MRLADRVPWVVPTIALILLLCGVGQSQGKKKIVYGILLDNTGSMRSQFDTVKEIAKGVVKQVHDHGPVSLFDFASQGIGRGSKAIPTARIEREQNGQILAEAINNLYVEGGQTTLLDAIEFIAQSLARAASDDKVIVL